MVLKRNFDDKSECYRQFLKVTLNGEIMKNKDKEIVSKDVTDFLRKQHIVAQAVEVTKEDIIYLYNIL